MNRRAYRAARRLLRDNGRAALRWPRMNAR